MPKNLWDVKHEKYKDIAGLQKQFSAALKVDNGKGTCLEKLNKLINLLGSKSVSIADVAEKFFNGKYDLFETVAPVLDRRVQNAQTGIWERVQAEAGQTAFNGKDMQIVLNKRERGQINNFIHELVHSSGNNREFLEREITDAIQKLEGKRMGLNNFIGTYCRKGGL